MSTEKLIDSVLDFRRRISPRTSYESSNELLIVTEKERIIIHSPDIDILHIAEKLVQSREFSHFKSVPFDNHALEGISVNNQVILSVHPNIEIIRYFAQLVSSRKTILTHCILPASRVEAIRSLVSQLESEMNGSVQILIDLVDTLVLITLHRSSLLHQPAASSSSSSVSTGEKNSLHLGNWGHPSVYSRRQFLYLWTNPGAVDGRRRVLQRLINNNVKRAGKTYKLKGEYFDQLISGITQEEGSDDYTVYSTLRKVFKEKSLDSNTSIEYPLPPTMLIPVKGDDWEEEGDGRANFMASRTFECIPKDRIGKIHTYLDYGCAEGSITDLVRQQVHVDVTNAYGADVRSLDPKGFNFLLLPREDEVPAIVGTILPTLTNQSVELITSAMVFHHVRHVEAALLELNRVMASTGVLVLREHDCQCASDAVFLDITHGLYSLVLSDPIEWPAFLDEYKAWYRSREQWNDMLLKCGFVRLDQSDNYNAKKHYESSRGPINSNPQTGPICSNLNMRNVIKAYYAVYVPCSPDAILLAKHTTQPHRSTSSVIKHEDTKFPSEQIPKRQKLVMEESSVANKQLQLPVNDTVILFESTKYPGRYYIIDSQGKTQWLTAQPIIFANEQSHTFDTSNSTLTLGTFIHPATKEVTCFHRIKKS